MKLCIVFDVNEGRNNFVNVTTTDIDGISSLPDYEFIRVNSLSDLSSVAYPGEVKELVALDVIEYLPLNEVDKCVSHWCDLVAVNGTITLGSLDIFEVGAALYTQKFPLSQEDANLLIHGHQQHAWQHKHANYGVRQMSEMLEGRGLVVTRKSLNRLWSVVQAKRN